MNQKTILSPLARDVLYLSFELPSDFVVVYGIARQLQTLFELLKQTFHGGYILFPDSIQISVVQIAPHERFYLFWPFCIAVLTMLVGLLTIKKAFVTVRSHSFDGGMSSSGSSNG